jgi:thiopurine S-methyltransferase
MLVAAAGAATLLSPSLGFTPSRTIAPDESCSSPPLSSPSSPPLKSPLPLAASAAETSPVHSLDFWSKRWADKLTGWHQAHTHASLINHGDSCFPVGSTVLVPLCGKTVDMASLATRGRSVVGVDAARKAFQEFADEQRSAVQLDAENDSEEHPNFETYKGTTGVGTTVSLLRGDFFELNLPEPVQGVWDRAAFVAIKPELRAKYAETLGRNLAPGGTILMSTFYRVKGTPEALAGGPPFSVSSVNVWDVFGELEWVRDPILQPRPRQPPTLTLLSLAHR